MWTVGGERRERSLNERSRERVVGRWVPGCHHGQVGRRRAAGRLIRRFKVDFYLLVAAGRPPDRGERRRVARDEQVGLAERAFAAEQKALRGIECRPGLGGRE